MNLYIKYTKPTIDFLLAFLLVFLLIPIWIVTSIFILLDNGFPIIYRQSRTGLKLKEFNIYKFRTMVKNADELGITSTKANDSRITRTGRLLRKLSIDELPQLFNVIKGDMSLVGFRPGVKTAYKPEDCDLSIFTVKPGITGLAQVSGRSSLTPAEKRKLEVEYSNNISFLLDVKILYKTFLRVLKGSSAF